MDKNNLKQVLLNLFLFISVFSVFSIVVLSSLFTYLYNLSYYDKKYREHKVYDIFPREKALNETRNILGYFKSQNDLDLIFFNAEEKSHLADVKMLISSARYIYYISLGLFWIILALMFILWRIYFSGFFARVMFLSGIALVSIILLLGLIYFLFGFGFIFEKFHELFFTGNFAFDPAISNMKALFPDNFFRDMGVSIITNILLKSLLILVFGFYMKRKITKMRH